MSEIFDRAYDAFTYPRTPENLAFLENIFNEAKQSGTSQDVERIGWLIEGFRRDLLSGNETYQGPSDIQSD